MKRVRNREDWIVRIIVEIILVWLLIALRLFGFRLFTDYVRSSVCFHLSIFDEVMLLFRAYSYYVPVEVMVSILCIGFCTRKILAFSFKKSYETFINALFVVLPLIAVSAYSLCWLFIGHPAFVDGQHKYIYNQRQGVHKFIELKAQQKAIEMQKNADKGAEPLAPE